MIYDSRAGLDVTRLPSFLIGKASTPWIEEKIDQAHFSSVRTILGDIISTDRMFLLSLTRETYDSIHMAVGYGEDHWSANAPTNYSD